MIKSMRSTFSMIDHRTVAGYVLDAAEPERSFVVEILADGLSVATAVAGDFNPALAAEGVADPRRGFVVSLPSKLVAATRIISARIANLDIPVGAPIDLDQRPKVDPMQLAPGAVESVEGGVLSGWVEAGGGDAVAVYASTAGEELAATVARTWISRPIGGTMRQVLAFELRLPVSLGDGAKRHIAVSTSTGLPLSGSPVTVTWTHEAEPRRS